MLSSYQSVYLEAQDCGRTLFLLKKPPNPESYSGFRPLVLFYNNLKNLTKSSTFTDQDKILAILNGVNNHLKIQKNIINFFA